MTVLLRRAIAVEGLRYTGAQMIPQVQQFLAPMSPAYSAAAPNAIGQGGELWVYVRDYANEAQYKSLGAKQYKLHAVPVGHWIIKDQEGNVSVASPDEINRDFDPDVAMPAGGDLPNAPETHANVAEEIPPAAPELRTTPFPLGEPIVATHPRAVMAADAAARNKVVPAAPPAIPDREF